MHYLSRVRNLLTLLALATSALCYAQNQPPDIQWSADGGSGPSRTVSYSPNGSLIACGDDDGYLRIWLSNTGELLFSPIQAHSAYITSVSFSPDGQTVATCSWDKYIRIWNVQSGTLKLAIYAGMLDGLHDIAYSPDGLTIASAGADEHIRLWSTLDGRPLRSWIAHSSDVLTILYSQEGRELISGSVDGSIRVWNARTGMLQRTLNEHTDWVFDLSRSSDGRLVAASSWDGTISIWTTNPWSRYRKLYGHSGRVFGTSFSSNGSKLLSVAHDSTINKYDVALGTIEEFFDIQTQEPWSIQVSPNGQLFAFSRRDGEVLVARVDSRIPRGIWIDESSGHGLAKGAAQVQSWLGSPPLNALLSPRVEVDNLGRRAKLWLSVVTSTSENVQIEPMLGSEHFVAGQLASRGLISPSVSPIWRAYFSESGATAHMAIGITVESLFWNIVDEIIRIAFIKYGVRVPTLSKVVENMDNILTISSLYRAAEKFHPIPSNPVILTLRIAEAVNILLQMSESERHLIVSVLRNLGLNVPQIDILDVFGRIATAGDLLITLYDFFFFAGRELAYSYPMELRFVAKRNP